MYACRSLTCGGRADARPRARRASSHLGFGDPGEIAVQHALETARHVERRLGVQRKCHKEKCCYVHI